MTWGQSIPSHERSFTWSGAAAGGITIQDAEAARGLGISSFFYEIHRMSLQRINPGNRLCDATIHNGVVYLAGQIPADASLPIGAQTQSVLAQIDSVLAAAGSDKEHILSATIYLAAMADFAGMNAAWDAWLGSAGIGPARATVEARLARPEIKVEIMVTAAVKA